MENQLEVNLNEDILSCPAVKPKKPRSEKQLENDKKLGQRLREKNLLKKQQQQQQQEEQPDIDTELKTIREAADEIHIEVVVPKVKRVVRPKLKRSQSIYPPVFEEVSVL